MVNHKNFVVDEGILKCVPEVNMGIKNDYESLCWKKSKLFFTKKAWNEEAGEMLHFSVRNENFKEAPKRILYALDKTSEDHQEALLNERCKWTIDICNKSMIRHAGSEQAILDYLDIKPFIPSVMINISPDWESVGKRTNTCKIKILSDIIEKYLAEGNRYSKASYVIENGSKGDFIHAHVVAEMNGSLIKSVNTHLAKGNHTKQLIKLADKRKGMEGMLKGVGIQKVFLRTPELVSDKLDYLIEAKKPEGHKNHSVIFERKDLVF